MGSSLFLITITVNDEQEVVKEVERFWGNLFCTNGKVTLGQKKEMIGNGMINQDPSVQGSQ